MMSGDIEQNPGPLNSCSITNTASFPVYNILESRLEQLGLRPLDVGGEGDCFFRAISHQLYGDCNHHLNVRTAGVRYMRENPERFIESNLESSWNEYLANMSLEGTWCDHLVIQAVADILNLRIHIVESDENFASFNAVEAVGLAHQPTVVHIGHLGEYHYVSTSQLNSRVPNVERNLYITMKHNKQKQKRREYMKEYMRKKRLSQAAQEREKCNEQKRNYMKNKRLSETFFDKQRKNEENKEYMRKKRLCETSQTKEKRNRKNKECMKKKRLCETSQTKEKRNRKNKECMEKKRLCETSENKEKRNWQNKTYMEKKRSGNQSLQSLIISFHDVVSEGPLYICSCCDRLWYKHSVSPAATLRETNPDVKKYLQNKTSVDDAEWLCKSRQNYLAKNKVPPCATINGMQFPLKPPFFDLNELECRLIAGADLGFFKRESKILGSDRCDVIVMTSPI